MKSENSQNEQFFILHINDGLLYDSLYRYSQEYSIPIERFTTLALQHFVNDIELFRSLRTGGKDYLCSSSK